MAETDTTLETEPVTDIVKTVQERAGAKELPAGTEFTPIVQKVKEDEEILSTPAAIDTALKATPTEVPTTDLDVTVPSAQNAEKYVPNTIEGTP